MDFEFNEDQELLRESVRRFLEDNAPISPYVRDMVDDERGTSDAVWSGLADLGLMGILVPEEYGGAGLGMIEMGVVLEEMGRLVHPGPYLSSALGAVSLIRAVGSASDCAQWLPGIADGTRIAAVALHEAPHRTDWRASHCEAKPDGAAWLLSGAKHQVPDGLAADALLVVARDPEGLGVFVVEAGAGGATFCADQNADATRKLASVEFDGCPARRLGDGEATAAIESMLDHVLIGLVVDGVGAASRALEVCVDFVKQRIQFGVPVGSFQAVQHMLADMLQALELGRAGAYYALWAADEAEPAERHRAAVMAKAYASDAFAKIGADAIQAHGGVGFTWEYDIHFYFKRLLHLQHAHGASSEHLEELAKIALD